MSRRMRIWATFAFAAALVLSAGLVGLDEALTVLPAATLLVLLAVGCFPGAEVIERLRVTHAVPRRRRKISVRPSVPTPRATAPRGATLLGFNLAVRPPPAGAHAA